MEMTPNEILRNYNEAKNKKLQIDILADLNCCDRETIERIISGKPEKADIRQMLIERMEKIDEEIKSLEKQYKQVSIALAVVGELLEGAP